MNNSIKKWLSEHGYNYRDIQISFNSGVTDAIMVNTNYTGEHPPVETFRAHTEIQRYINRFHSDCMTEERGHWTGFLIYKPV